MSKKTTSESEKIIENFIAYKNSSYKDIDLDRLAVFTLWKLQKVNLPLYFNFAAVAAFKLFPEKFSMVSFPEYPDNNRANKALRRLTDAKRRNWATGNVENGFFLTDLGKEVAEEVEQSISSPHTHAKVISSRSRGRSSVDDVRDIKESDLFKQWKETKKASPHEFFSFLKAAPYTQKSLLVERMKELNQSAIDAHDEEVLLFLSWVKENFSNVLNAI
jgi:hypothetical protein